jgi:hypothetical protein
MNTTIQKKDLQNPVATSMNGRNVFNVPFFNAIQIQEFYEKMISLPFFKKHIMFKYLIIFYYSDARAFSIHIHFPTHRKNIMRTAKAQRIFEIFKQGLGTHNIMPCSKTVWYDVLFRRIIMKEDFKNSEDLKKAPLGNYQMIYNQCLDYNNVDLNNNQIIRVYPNQELPKDFIVELIPLKIFVICNPISLIQFNFFKQAFQFI